MKKLKKTLSIINSTLSFAFLILFFGTFISWRSFKEKSAVDFSDKTAVKVAADDLWKSVESLNLSGVVLIEQGNDILFARSTKLITANSPLFVGSVTKQWTGEKILELEAKGLLSVQDPLCKHLEDFCEGNRKEITIQQVLSHKSGLQSSSYKPWAIPMAFVDLFRHVDLKDLTTGDITAPKTTPGTEYEYSNLGFNILARLIETKTGESYDVAMRTVFESNGLKNSFIKHQEATPNQFTRWNMRLLGTLRLGTFTVPSDLFHFENTYGAGAAISSANDLMSWAQASLKNGRADEKLKIAQGVTHLKGIQFKDIWYINGWVVDPKKNLVWHNGAIFGYRSLVVLHPPSKTTAVFIFNSLKMSSDEEKVILAWEKMLSGQEYSSLAQ